MESKAKSVTAFVHPDRTENTLSWGGRAEENQIYEIPKGLLQIHLVRGGGRVCRDAGNPHHQSIPDAWRQQFFCILQLQPTEKPEQLGKPGVLTAEGKPLGAYL